MSGGDPAGTVNAVSLQAVAYARAAAGLAGLLLAVLTWLSSMIYQDVRSLSARMIPAEMAAEQIRAHDARIVALEIEAAQFHRPRPVAMNGGQP